MLEIRRLWNWCRRFRHRCGYGVHSPSDFYLITSVIYEKLPYYAYDELKKNISGSSQTSYREKVNRLLFRLVNYFHPDFLVEIGSGDGTTFSYLRAARHSMNAISLPGRDWDITEKALQEVLDGKETIDFLHVGYTPYYKEVVSRLLPYMQEGSCLIVGNIHASKEKEYWWKQLMEQADVRITFDLYDIGIVLFPSKRYKQNYIVNFF